MSTNWVYLDDTNVNGLARAFNGPFACVGSATNNFRGHFQPATVQRCRWFIKTHQLVATKRETDILSSPSELRKFHTWILLAARSSSDHVLMNNCTANGGGPRGRTRRRFRRDRQNTPRIEIGGLSLAGDYKLARHREIKQNKTNHYLKKGEIGVFRLSSNITSCFLFQKILCTQETVTDSE